MSKALFVLLRLIIALVVLLLAVFVAAASYYWLGWPDIVRMSAALLAVPFLWGLWVFPGAHLRLRRVVCSGAMIVFFAAYFTKSPIPQAWVPLHEETASVEFDGNLVTINNFRDAVHLFGAPSEPRWEARTFDLDGLESAQLILQPFGESAATVHVMTTFRFADDQYLAISVEARRTSWSHFDPVAGFFRHDELYIVLGNERDVLWKRLARVPPNELYFFEFTRPKDEVRNYLETLLRFAEEIHETPSFYSTATESCYTTLLRLSPNFNRAVPWYDPRRWLPGDSISLFQELQLVDNTVSTDDLINNGKLKPDVMPPWDFSTPEEWSRHLRSMIGPSGLGEFPAAR